MEGTPGKLISICQGRFGMAKSKDFFRYPLRVKALSEKQMDLSLM